MGDLCHPFVPVFVAEVIDYPTGRLWEIFEKFFIVFVEIIYCRSKHDAFAIRANPEALYAVLFIGQAFLPRSVCIYAEDLSCLGFFVITEECYLFPVLNPLQITL